MKNIEKYVKSSLKKKITVNRALIILFMITGSFSMVAQSKGTGNDSFSPNGYVLGDNSMVAKDEEEVEKINKIFLELKKLKEELEELEFKKNDPSNTDEVDEFYEGEIKNKKEEIKYKENELFAPSKKGKKNSYAIGNKTTTLGDNSYTLGYDSFTKGDETYSLGNKNKVYGDSNQVHGNKNKVYGNKNISFGLNNKIGTEGTKVNNNIVLGSNITIDGISNAIVFGDSSTPVANAVSIGNSTTKRQLKFVAEGTDATDAVNVKQLQDYVRKKVAGTVVYTDKDGNKLMKDTNGKFYKANADGTKEKNAKEVVSENVILSTVNPDGETTKPITLGNVASALGLSENDNEDKKKEILNKLINKEVKKDVYKDAELNKVVTLRDLQFLASKGITFAGSTGTDNKYYLGDTITINGTTSDYNGLNDKNFVTKYETKNIAVKVDNKTGNIEVGLAKELSKINSITSKEDAKDKTKTKITLSKDGATFGVEKDVTIGNTTTTQQVGVKTKIGEHGISLTKQGDDEQHPSVSMKAGDNTNGPSIDFAIKEEGQGNDKKTVGTGSITGLKDLGADSDGHMAANKNYVDKKFDDVANKVVNINNQVRKNSELLKKQIKTVGKLSRTPIKFGTNSGYVDKKLGDAIKIKGTGTVKKYDEEYNSNNIATKTDKKGNIVIGISKELKDMKSFETEQDKTTGNRSKLDKNGLTITDKDDKNTGTKDNPRHTVEITKDKIVFKKEYKDGNKNNVENGIVIDNKSNTITGIKTKDTDKGDTVVSKQYVDDKLSQKTFEYFIKNTVLGSDGKEYSKDTVEVDGKRFEGTDKVIKGEDNNYYKEKDIKGRKYDSKTQRWSGIDTQPKPVAEAKPLNSTNLIRGKDGKFYNPLDLENAIYDKDSTKYKKNGKDVKSGKEANDVVIKALPNNKPMTLTNIGDGRIIANSTDAVNGGQVYEALKGKLNLDGSNLDDKSKEALIKKLSDGANIDTPKNILVTDKQVNEHLKNNYYNKSNIDKMIGDVDKKSDLALGGVANAVAMANLVQVNSYSRHRHNLSAAYGYYGGSHALAVGFSGTNEERNFVYKLSGSVNNKGNLAFGVGAGVMLGEEHDTFPSIDNKKINEVTKKLDEANKKISEYEDDKKQTAKKFKELEDKYENDKKESNKKLQEMERKLEMLMKKFK